MAEVALRFDLALVVCCKRLAQGPAVVVQVLRFASMVSSVELLFRLRKKQIEDEAEYIDCGGDLEDEYP